MWKIYLSWCVDYVCLHNMLIARLIYNVYNIVCQYYIYGQNIRQHHQHQLSLTQDKHNAEYITFWMV